MRRLLLSFSSLLIFKNSNGMEEQEAMVIWELGAAGWNLNNLNTLISGESCRSHTLFTHLGTFGSHTFDCIAHLHSISQENITPGKTGLERYAHYIPAPSFRYKGCQQSKC